jgi:hypothetical protein
MSYLVAGLFATTNILESQKSTASGMVATTGAVWGWIDQEVCGSSQVGLPEGRFANQRYRWKRYRRNESSTY